MSISLEKFKEESDANIEKIHASQVVFRASELLERKVKSMPYLVESLLQKVGLVALAGSSDTGKSSFLRQLATAIVANEAAFLGFPLHTKYNKAIYVSTEDDDIATSFLLQKGNAFNDYGSDKIAGLKYIFETHEIYNRLDKELSEEPADIVFIDAFTDLYGKSMNDSNQVRTFLNDYSQLANKHKCLVMFLHHTGKRTEDFAPSKHNLLGSQGFEAKMRLVIELRSDRDYPANKHMCIVKGNYLPKEMKTESFVLKFCSESLTFTNTGKRTLYDELIPSGGNSEQKDLIRNMKSDGKTQVEIAKKLGISQATVSRCLK